MKHSFSHQQHGTIFEFVAQGRYVKVSAIDTRTGREVAIVGDRRLSQKTLEHQALRKLRYVLYKEKRSS